MNVGVVNESAGRERRVALVPAVIPALKKAGHEVLVETGAGLAAGYPDSAYGEKGATLLANAAEVLGAAQLIARVGAGAVPASPGDSHPYRAGQVVVAPLDPLSEPGAVADLARTGATAFALELVPRITRAQAMDILS